MRFLTIFILLSLPFLVFSDSGENFSDIIDEIVKEVSESNESNRPVRLAVMTFISTGISDKNEFGIYFTESVISALAVQSKKYTASFVLAR